jgi:chromate transporter
MTKKAGGPGEVFRAFLWLGCTCFGGPIAHFGYFQKEFVTRRKWIEEEGYADLVALCQFLPGPASSQVGLALGWKRAGWKGALAAWVGFTLPSVVLMVAFAYGVRAAGDLAHFGLVQGLKIAAAAVVAQAVATMARKLCPDPTRAAVAITVAVVLTLFPGSWMQLMAIAAGAAATGLCYRWLADLPIVTAPSPTTRASGFFFLALFFGLLIALPWLAQVRPSAPLLMLDSFYRAGALVFGGGHVVLPLLQQSTVQRGWVGQDTFLAGYGAAQALPGPLFAFSAYLGTFIAPRGIEGALLALGAIYLPAVLILFGALPQWERLRGLQQARVLLAGANAAVVGLLAAAFYSPILITTITSPKRFALALCAYGALQLWRTPPWIVVAACAGVGAIWFG